MTAVHAALAIASAAALAFIVAWAVIAKIARRPPGPAFERSAIAVAGLLALQVLMGLIILATGHRRGVLHYVYGVAAFAAILAGTLLSRALHRDRWVALAWTAFVTGLLVLRALMTGYHRAA